MQVTITSASASTAITNATDLHALGLRGVGPTDDQPQIAAITGYCDTSGGTATIRMALADKDRVWFYRDITVTPTAVRTGWAGNTGDYVASVVCSDSSDNKADLIGASPDRRWYLFAPASFTTITSVTLHFQMSNVV